MINTCSEGNELIWTCSLHNYHFCYTSLYAHSPQSLSLQLRVVFDAADGNEVLHFTLDLSKQRKWYLAMISHFIPTFEQSIMQTVSIEHKPPFLMQGVGRRWPMAMVGTATYDRSNWNNEKETYKVWCASQPQWCGDFLKNEGPSFSPSCPLRCRQVWR